MRSALSPDLATAPHAVPEAWAGDWRAHMHLTIERLTREARGTGAVQDTWYSAYRRPHETRGFICHHRLRGQRRSSHARRPERANAKLVLSRSSGLAGLRKGREGQRITVGGSFAGDQ